MSTNISLSIKNLKLCGEKILIKPIQLDKSESVFKLPDSQKEKPTVGSVVLIGDGQMSEPGKTYYMNIKINQEVLFQKWNNQEVILDNEKYIIIKYSDIIGIWRDTNE